ncbi:MAG: radical SAM family heme chaperone HemW [Chloroflexota bacterium]|nr:radical SAM family heme chaperone HemW [Chloroflexota bacterium]
MKQQSDIRTGTPSEVDMSRGISLYIHIPFCETKCPYCDFNTYSGIEHMMSEYVDALIFEIDQWGKALAREGTRQSINTVFFGGGTPSYLDGDQIARIMDVVTSQFRLSDEAEITLESNPGDITANRVTKWVNAQINRLSIGAQSFNNDLLQFLGRRHDAEGIRKGYDLARAGGITNINLDLMFGLPYQTLAQWHETLKQVISMQPEHISMYCLTLEEGTPLNTWVSQGHVPDPDPDLAADMYILANDLANTAGYHRYEISNWALQDKASRHNLTYWRNQPYIGIGPGAHSYFSGYRFANIRSPRQYIQRINKYVGNSVYSWNLDDLHRQGVLEYLEAIDIPLQMSETMMMGLRLAEGVANISFETRFGIGLRAIYDQQIHELEALELLEWDDEILRLTDRGWLLGNEVFQRFFH